jgi:two-component system phosphate regulon sensor histidine kinase PhoR
MTIRAKLILSFSILSLVLLLIAGSLSTFLLDGFFKDRLVDELKTHSRMIEYILTTGQRKGESPDETLRHLAASLGLRLTLVMADGAVVFESELPESSLHSIENHSGRPEIAEALRNGDGIASRHSVTIGADMMYYARRIDTRRDGPDGFPPASIVRLGIPLTEIRAMLDDITRKVFLASTLVFAVVLLVSIFIAYRVSSPLREMERIATRIRSGDLDLRLPVRSRDEIGILCETLNSMIDALNADISKLKRLERVRTEFLGNVSHELRTPIFALQASLETLIGGAVNDPAVNIDFLDKALKNTRRLDDLLSDLIEISRIESGDMKMSFRYFDSLELIRHAVAEVQPQADRKSISIGIRHQGIPVDVFGDRERLKQVLLNLLSNAIKYTDERGNITVNVEFGRAGAGFSVVDSGCGIAPEHLSRIFERFYRVDSGRSRDVGGTGLGLAIVKHIVEAHGSKVEVASSVGAGSTFTFHLKT